MFSAKGVETSVFLDLWFRLSGLGHTAQNPRLELEMV